MNNDPSKPLANVKHEKFCLLFAAGEVSASEAYRLRVSDKGTAKSINEMASALCLKVDSRIQWLRAKATEKAEAKAEAVTLTMAEKLEFCARLVKLKGAKIDEERDGDLINGVSYDRTGQRVLKVPCKIAALKLHNDLASEGAEAKGMTGLATLAKRLRV